MRAEFRSISICEDMGEWLKSITTSERLPNVDIEIPHRTATLCILGNLAYMLGRKLDWDGVQQKVIGDEHANRMLGKPQRHPYHL